MEEIKSLFANFTIKCDCDFSTTYGTMWKHANVCKNKKLYCGKAKVGLCHYNLMSPEDFKTHSDCLGSHNIIKSTHRIEEDELIFTIPTVPDLSQALAITTDGGINFHPYCPNLKDRMLQDGFEGEMETFIAIFRLDDPQINCFNINLFMSITEDSKCMKNFQIRLIWNSTTVENPCELTLICRAETSRRKVSSERSALMLPFYQQIQLIEPCYSCNWEDYLTLQGVKGSPIQLKIAKLNNHLA